jgi:Concanavalin A-like lectin/glucanases superfamily/Immunoglobulin domain
MKTRKLTSFGSLAMAFFCAGALVAQNVGQWDFNNQDLSQTAGANLGDLTYIDGTTGQTVSNTVFGTTTALGIPDINGVPANVMEFPSGVFPMGYYMPTPPANAGGSLVNEYTLIMDVYYPKGGILRPLLQMDDGILDHIHALFDVGLKDQIEVTNTAGGVLLPSGEFSKVAPNTWYRLGLVFDWTNGTASVYTNGELAGVLNFSPPQDMDNLDSPFALLANSYLPIFSSTFTNALGYVNSLQVRDEVLSPGEMEAIGGPSASGIPINLPPAHSYIASRSPDFGAVGIGPEPTVQVVINQGSTTINPSTITMYLDGTLVPATVVPTNSSEYSVTYAETNTILDPLSSHTIEIAYTDSLQGEKSYTWSFTVAQYQNINLPPPIYFENFDEVPEGVTTNGGTAVWNLPTGWSVTNDTVAQTPGYDLSDGQSDAYLNWVVVNTNRLEQIASGEDGTYTSPTPGYNYTPILGSANGPRRLIHPPIVLNGVLLDALATGNCIESESDQRQNAGGQVDYLFTRDYDLTGYTNVYVKWNSLYEQNQDNIASCEYSVDQGQTWLPVLYMLDNGVTSGDPSDVVTNSATGQIDVFATFGTARSDQAYNLAYSNFIGAVVSTNLIPAIQGRVNDDPLNSKRIEVYRIPLADNCPHVRFRFGQAGTSSWYWGIDDFGLYSISYPVITTQPLSQTVDANTTTTFSVGASGAPLAYQWRFNGNDISDATNSTYVIQSTSPTNAGVYTVIVRNSSGPVTSSPAQLTVNTTPQITTDLSGQIVDPGTTVYFPAQATGGHPLTYLFYHNNGLLSASGNNILTLSDVQAANIGNYQLVVSNSYGAVTGLVASLRIYAGPITSNLVVHLTFDGNMTDTSGRGNNATYAYNGADAGTSPRFAPGFLGQAFEFTTKADESDVEYATLGYPPDLRFGDSNDFSVSMWVNYTNQNDDPPLISDKDWESSDNLGWGIFTQSGGNYRINVTGPNGGADKFSVTDTPHVLKDGKWHNIVVSVQHAPYGQSAYIYGYLDGVLVSEHPMHVAGTIDTFGTPFSNSQATNGLPLPDNQSTWAVNIGQEGTGLYTDRGSAYNIDAKIDDVGIWRRALTANEAAGIYAAGLAGKDLSQAITPSELVISVSGGDVHISWVGNATVKLQTSPTLDLASWTDVSGTLGASSATIPIGNGQAFFRLSQ